MKRQSRSVAQLPFDKALAQAKALSATLAPFDVALSAKDRNRRLKMPSKSADAVGPIVNLAKTYGLGAYTAPIEEHQRVLAQLAALRVEIGAIQSVTSGIFMNSESETWMATTTVYTMLRRLARSNGELAHVLQPIVDKYFARGRRGATEAPAAGQATAPSARKKKKARGKA